MTSPGLFVAPPDGRTWRIATCWRGPPATAGQMIGELPDATSRSFHADLWAPCTAQCTIDGRSASAAYLQELSQDLILWRWNPINSRYDIMFRGPIGVSEDTISETTHAVNVQAADYRAMLGRVIYNAPRTFTQADQFGIVNNFILPLTSGQRQPNLGFTGLASLNPDGSNLGFTGVLRDRAYTGAEKTMDMLDNLSQVINGFDYAIEPLDPSQVSVAQQTGYPIMWYPQRGVTKAFVAEYGVTVGSLTRTVNSTEFGNWVRVDGQNNDDGSPMFATSIGDVWNNPQLHAEGLWQTGQSEADVSIQSTLQQTADGQLALMSQLIPSYTVNLTPGVWNSKADCWLGDTIELRVHTGRLDVDTSVRILAFDFTIDDAGVERIALTVGRSEVTFSSIMADQRARLDALSRR